MSAAPERTVTGLVVGKFCPLHKGHEALIAFAQARCDRLLILSYTKPEFPGCAPAQRSAWLAAQCPQAERLVIDDAALAAFARSRGEAPRLLPDNDAPAEDHRAFVAWVCHTMLGTTVDRVFTSEDYGDGFAAALAKSFGHPVTHSPFDRDRVAVPVSGTRVRADPCRHRAFLSEPVLQSFVPAN
ncbi:hypothetical protein [Sphingomonas sp.]|uniref:hypothetical protein n=1 Tax=Sphingomonas sp. TaxID=28214 RepID=UPI003B3BDCAF